MKAQTTATKKRNAEKTAPSVENTLQKAAANLGGFIRATKHTSAYRDGVEVKEIDVIFIAASTITEMHADEENGGTWLTLHPLSQGGRSMKKINEDLENIFFQLANCRK